MDLGISANVAPILEAVKRFIAEEVEPVEREFIDEIKRRLENWFTASPGETAPLFYYDKNWGTLVGSAPSYGSDSQLNDPHFHSNAQTMDGRGRFRYRNLCRPNAGR